MMTRNQPMLLMDLPLRHTAPQKVPSPFLHFLRWNISFCSSAKFLQQAALPTATPTARVQPREYP